MLVDEKRKRNEAHKKCRLISTQTRGITLKAFDDPWQWSFSIHSIILICFFHSSLGGSHYLHLTDEEVRPGEVRWLAQGHTTEEVTAMQSDHDPSSSKTYVLCILTTHSFY